MADRSDQIRLERILGLIHLARAIDWEIDQRVDTSPVLLEMLFGGELEPDSVGARMRAEWLALTDASKPDAG